MQAGAVRVNGSVAQKRATLVVVGDVLTFAMGDDVAVDTPEAGGRCDATAVPVLDGKFWELAFIGEKGGWNALRCMP